MPKVFIDETERFPELVITTPPGGKNGATVQVTHQKLAKWHAAIAAFEVVQKEMEAAVTRTLGARIKRDKKKNPQNYPPPPRAFVRDDGSNLPPLSSANPHPPVTEFELKNQYHGFKPNEIRELKRLKKKPLPPPPAGKKK